jgi:hypothetical protein
VRFCTRHAPTPGSLGLSPPAGKVTTTACSIRWRRTQHMALAMILVELKKEVGRKELELLGQSSDARAAAGSSDVFQRGEQAT